MKRIRYIIIEDEPLALLRTQEYASQVPFLDLVQTFNNAADALSLLQDDVVDLMFLDIQMEGITGVQLLQALPNPPYVILTTAYEEFALKAFELNVIDYLLKPYSFERFLSAVMKVRKSLKEMTPENGYLFLKNSNRLEKINLDDILFIEGARDYRKLHTSGKILLISETLIELSERLPENGFCRIHKSFIVSLSKIDAIEHDHVIIGQQRIPISDTYKKDFYEVIGRR